MSQLSGVNGSTSKPFGSANTLNEVNVDDFLKLMLAELQNQDPLNPLENDKLVAQIGQIRSVGATDKLTSTLDAVLLGQNISSATNLIGAEIDAISDDQQRVTGVVERVSVSNGQPKLHLDLNPRAAATADEGRVGAGSYEYRVVWEEGGTLFGVDPLATMPDKKITVGGRAGFDEAILISNLPATDSAKQVFRSVAGAGDFRLAGTITDKKASTFLDDKSTDELSDFVMPTVPQLINSQRQFEVSLKNVGEIRPPAL
jgi:flagellar basal-body rod modification protein FlgD